MGEAEPGAHDLDFLYGAEPASDHREYVRLAERLSTILEAQARVGELPPSGRCPEQAVDSLRLSVAISKALTANVAGLVCWTSLQRLPTFGS